MAAYAHLQKGQAQCSLLQYRSTGNPTPAQPRPCSHLVAASPSVAAPQSVRLCGSSTRASRSERPASVACQAVKVALLGAAGGIGQPLGLLLKMQPLIDELALYDIANVAGVAADLSHCNTRTQVSSTYTVPWMFLAYL